MASFRKGWFPKEDSFVKFGEELEKRKNIEGMIKVQKTLRRMTAFTFRGRDDVICSDDNFIDPTEDRDYPLSHLNNPSETRKAAADFVGERDQRKRSEAEKKRASLLKWFDQGSDSISLLFARSGHGSKVSLCLTAIFALGFLVFLSFFGVFKYHTST